MEGGLKQNESLFEFSVSHGGRNELHLVRCGLRQRARKKRRKENGGAEKQNSPSDRASTDHHRTSHFPPPVVIRHARSARTGGSSVPGSGQIRQFALHDDFR
jgi:hypothetical protein